jgi:hypothetical protein
VVTIGTNNLTVNSSAITTISAGIGGSTGNVAIKAATSTDIDGPIALTGAGMVNVERAVISGERDHKRERSLSSKTRRSIRAL